MEKPLIIFEDSLSFKEHLLIKMKEISIARGKKKTSKIGVLLTKKTHPYIAIERSDLDPKILSSN
jgi:hypothetical protein